MQTCLKISKFMSFFNYKLFFHIIGALYCDVYVTNKTGSSSDGWIY
jgi:hypothetical protein